MNFSVIENFYTPSDFGLVAAHFVNENFQATYQSRDKMYGTNRFNAYPCHESPFYKFSKDNPNSVANIFARTFEEKTKIKLLDFRTCLRKIKLKEFKKSKSWKQHKPHKDNAPDCDIAGVIYFNSGNLNDGTNLYKFGDDYVPTVIIGSYPNRCIFYDGSIPHTAGTEQEIEERWIQPFFCIIKEDTFKAYKEKNET